MARREFNRENALAYLKTYKQPRQLGVVVPDVEISSIRYTDKNGKQLAYAESGDEYAIVNLKAQNEYQFKESLKHLMAGDIQSATNEHLTYNITLEELEQTPLMKGQTCSLILHEVEAKDKVTREPTGEMVTVVKSFSVPVVKEVETFDFEAELAKMEAGTPDIKA